MSDSLFDTSYGYDFSQASIQNGSSILPTPDMADVFFQKSFNTMLSELTSAVVSDDGESDNSSDSDPFGSMFDVAALSGVSESGGIEQLMALNSGSALIGKEVEYVEDNEILTGVVEKVVIDSGVPCLIIGNSKVSVNDVLSVMGGS